MQTVKFPVCMVIYNICLQYARKFHGVGLKYNDNTVINSMMSFRGIITDIALGFPTKGNCQNGPMGERICGVGRKGKKETENEQSERIWKGK